MNDARPSDLSEFTRLGHVHAHLLQFSGVLWYPMVYELPQRAKTAFGKQKRDMQIDRTIRYIRDLKASWVFPISLGRRVFLDEELFHYNDLGGDEGNIFPDQQAFLDRYHGLGHGNGVILLPGSVAELSAEGCRVHHPVPDVRNFSARKVGGPVRLDLTGPDGETAESIVIDFPPARCAGMPTRSAATGSNPPCAGGGAAGIWRGGLDQRAVPVLPVLGGPDRQSTTSSSTRSSSACRRSGCSTPRAGTTSTSGRSTPRMSGEGSGTYSAAARTSKGGLSRFGVIEGNTLTCQLHGWQFDLPTGRCLNGVGSSLRARRVPE